MTDKKEEELHWSEEKEVVSSNKPLKFLLLLFKFFPRFVVHLFAFPVGFFYFLFSSRARIECRRYQKQLRFFSNGKEPPRIRSSVQIISFCLCVLEKMEGWLGKIQYKNLISEGEDLRFLIERLEKGEGAVLIGSHLGNIELLRSLSSFNRTGVKRSVPVTAIMEVKSTEQFNKTLEEINPGSAFNVIDPENITPDTMIFLQEEIEKGGLVVFAADRTSARSRSRVLRKDFLGKPADFPYGVFLLCFLLKAPVYYVFGLRSKTLTLFPKNYMFVEKSSVSLNLPRQKREEGIEMLSDEFVKTLEKYVLRFPYQWYNFYNFWLLNQDEKEEKDNKGEK